MHQYKSRLSDSEWQQWIDLVSNREAIADDRPSVMRMTRAWIQYGVFGFAITCIVIGAVESLFSR